MAITYPTVHWNGTSAGLLIEQYATAWESLHEAFCNLKLSAPNGRDYYPQGAGAYDKAADEHYDRMRRVKEVLDELEGLIEHIEAVKK